jgi:ribosomal protein S18
LDVRAGLFCWSFFVQDTFNTKHFFYNLVRKQARVFCRFDILNNGATFIIDYKEIAMAKKKCAHRGRVSRRIKTGPMHCHRTKLEVTIVVCENGNKCTHATCPFAKVEIPRTET